MDLTWQLRGAGVAMKGLLRAQQTGDGSELLRISTDEDP